MADPERPESQSTSASEDLHWGIYLREDLKDLRQEIQQEMQDLRRDLRQEIRQEVQGLREGIRQEVRDLRADAREYRAEVTGQFAELRKAMDTRFYWTVGIVVTLFGAQTALLTALFKP